MTKSKNESLSSADVIAWLKANPGFLQKNPDVLDALLPPKAVQGKGVVDFQFHMVQRLRADRDLVLESTKEIVETSRANMNSLARIHTAVLMLLEANSFEDFIRTMTMDLCAVLDVDIISLLVEADGEGIPQIDVPGVRAVAPGTVKLLMKDKKFVIEGEITGFTEVYGGGAGLVKSQALALLEIIPNAPPAVLAFGSRDPALFESGQGTELISFLCRVIERAFRSWLHL